MKEYFKMADYIIGDVSMSINHNGDVSVSYNYADPDMIVRKTMDAMEHAINSHDELVESVLHYEADALMWERRAVTEASRAQELVAEVERLRESLKWAVNNLPFENAFEWSDDENADAHYAALRLLGVDAEE